MALYHFTAKVISMGSGESAVHRAAYHARTQLADERNAKTTRDYAHKGDLAWSDIFAPKDAPDWTRDRAQLWNRAEAAERQANGQLARNIEFAMPNELSREQQIRLITDFVREQFARKGMVADANLHSDYDAHGKRRAGAKADEPRNDHVHVLLTMRGLDGDGFKKTKTDMRKFNSPEQLQEWRAQWAKHGAKALERAGFGTEAERFAVGHLTLPEQRQAAMARGDHAYVDSLDREPDMKQGATITQMEQRGQATERGDERRAIQDRNAERNELRAEAKIIDLELERLKRQEQKEQKAEPSRAAVTRQQARFDTWANARRADLQNQRLEADGGQGRAHGQQRRELEQRQQAAYGPQLDALRSEAATIKARQERGGFFYRITGRAAADRQLSAQVQAGIASIGQRKTEQQQALDARQQAETARLESRHARQASQLETRIEQARARREAEGWIPQEARREATTGLEIDREAENLTVEGVSFQTHETAPQNEQAASASPEPAREGNSGEGQEHGDHDPGRTMT